MSFKHIAWAMHIQVGDPLAKLLLIALADRADKETNQCWPSLARLCADTEMSMATVTRKLLYLEEKQLLKRTKRDNTSTLYTLSLTESTLSHTERPPSLTVSVEPISTNLSKNLNNNNTINDEFEQFWEHYPRKTAKGQARNAFKGAIKKATLDELIAGAKAYSIVASKTEKQFIPHASTWLNGERWLDETTDETWGNIDDL